MAERPHEPLEGRLRAAGAAFPYPPTPDLAAAERRRLGGRSFLPEWPRVAVALLLVAALLLAVPGVRAGVLEWIQIGTVRILLDPTPLPVPAPARPTSLLDLVGETTLEEARLRLQMPLYLPTYPPDLGSPDHLFVQDIDGEATILAWTNPEEPDEVVLALHQLDGRFWMQKSLHLAEAQLAETEVNGRRAIWLTGPHFLEVVRPDGRTEWAERRLVGGNVLLWSDRDHTYRLESTLSLEEAVRIAESLR